MAKRHTIYLEEFSHGNPIPVACRIGDLLVSGIVYGRDPETGKAADTLDRQCALMFQHMRTVVEAGGGTIDDIVKITVWMNDRSQRDPLNREWLAMFPDPDNRPVRQAMAANLTNGILIQCDFIARIN